MATNLLQTCWWCIFRRSGTFEFSKRPLTAVNPCATNGIDPEDPEFDQSSPYYDQPEKIHLKARVRIDVKCLYNI